MKKTLQFLILILAHLPFYSQVGDKPNIVFITIDDLNDYVGILGGHPQIETPSIDSLAREGMLFTNAYANSPLCAPSRTSFMSGKDLHYTQVFNSDQVEDFFRDNFTAAQNNEEVISIPEHLKDHGYYTFGINKVFHNSNFLDYDAITSDPCEKDLSWSRVINFEDFGWVLDEMEPHADGIPGFQWGRTDDDLEVSMEDYRAVDTAIQFIEDVAAGDIDLCNGYFFLAVGIARPHLDLFIPEKFYPEFYVDNVYAEPFDYAFNVPENAYPPNGVIMPPQPDTIWNDYYHLGPLGQSVSKSQKELENNFTEWRIDLGPLPEINDTLTEEERNFIIEQSQRANAVMGYMAGIQYVDAQIGRLINELESHPDIYNNTIIILVSDNGFSMGEKRHWLKRSLWETDIRVPFIIVHPLKPGNLICNRTVSLLDIYPTICAMAEIPEPSFLDGSDYLDGKNIFPLLNNPNKHFESPVLVSWEGEPSKECSCWPQYAVRSERFHYIKYQSDNGTIGTNPCNSASSIKEEELYDVGVNRETDPNEWNNLIANGDYAPVIHYLQQFLPDSSLYLQKAYSVEITNKVLPCLLPSNYKLKLQTKLYNTDGVLLSGAALTDYQFKWTNNVTAAVQYGKVINFNCLTIPAATFAVIDKIMFFLEVTQISTGKFVGFTTKTFYLNPVNSPSAGFNLVTDDILLTAAITDYEITGSYNNTYWNFDDGFISEDFLPATHTYSSHGVYAVTNYIQYGNGCLTSENEIADLSLRKGMPAVHFSVYPNPANSILTISATEELNNAHISIINSMGQVVYKTEFNLFQEPYTFNTGHLPSGNYIIEVKSDEFSDRLRFEIIR